MIFNAIRATLKFESAKSLIKIDKNVFDKDSNSDLSELVINFD